MDVQQPDEARAEPIRIVLAEDHSLMREGTRRILEQCPDMVVVGLAKDGEQALELIERLQPDVAVLDIHMPKLNGIEVVRRMKQIAPKTKPLILTAFDDDDYILALMEIGATGYLLKTAPISQVLDSIRSVSQDEAAIDPAIVAKIAHLWAYRQPPAAPAPLSDLSVRETEVLELASRGCRNKAIADQLHVSVRTIEGHFNRIFYKLGVSSRIEAVLHILSRQSGNPETRKRP